MSTKIIKVLCIGDIHGKDVWKKIVKENKYNFVFFVGDYVDDFHIPLEIQTNNLIDIINFKKKYPGEVILGLGNHDIQYFSRYLEFTACIGIEEYKKSFKKLHPIFKTNAHLFQLGWQINNTLFVHGGVHNAWVNNHSQKELINLIMKDDLNNNETGLIDYLNQEWINFLKECNPNMFHSKMKDNELFWYGKIRSTFRGNNIVGGPIWFDHTNIYSHGNVIEGYNQITGHTRTDNIKSKIVNGNLFWAIDCLKQEIENQEALVLEFEYRDKRSKVYKEPFDFSFI